MPTIRNSLSALSLEDLVPILDSISDAIFIDDAKGYTLWINRASEEVYKIKRKNIIGKHVSFLEDEGIFTPSVARLVMEQQKEVSIIHENKEGKRLLTRGIPILDKEGNISKIITTSNDITELVSLQNQLESVQNTLFGLAPQEKFNNEGLVAASQAMYNVLQLIKRLATVDSTVLITGESGVGKGLVANLLHKNGSRRDSPFIKVNCGAIPENLIESELFGYERGAFTGSKNEGKKGLFEAAENGTIFLDEISELPLNMQVKLLQVIQEREFTKVGGITSTPTNVRIISATNRDLLHLVHENKFREDLYYRLNVVPISVPPLRERTEDLLPLIKITLNENNKKLGDHKELDHTALAMLMKYSWPGNVRELQNIIERLIITTRGPVILPENLPWFIIDEQQIFTNQKGSSIEDLKETLNDTEKALLIKIMAKYKSTRAAAKALGVSQPTVVRKLQKHKISSGDSF